MIRPRTTVLGDRQLRSYRDCGFQPQYWGKMRQSRRVNSLLPLALLLLSSFPLYGGIVLDVAIAPPTFAPASSVVTVSARKVNASDPDVLMTAANLPFDLGNDGFGLPTGFSIDSIATSTNFSADLNTATPAALDVAGENPNFDAIVNLNAGSVNIDSTSNIPLFELTIGIAASVSSSTNVPLSIVSSPNPLGFFSFTPQNVGGVPIAIATSLGSVSVIPEPSSLLLLALIGLCTFLWRIKR